MIDSKKHSPQPNTIEARTPKTIITPPDNGQRPDRGRQREVSMESLRQILMDRDGLTEGQAGVQIAIARHELLQRIDDGELPGDFMMEYFGLEPDFLTTMAKRAGKAGGHEPDNS